MRRQELPDDALAECATAAGKCDWEYEVVAVSHGWLLQGHADPIGARKEDVANISKVTGGDLVFWDFISLYEVPVD